MWIQHILTAEGQLFWLDQGSFSMRVKSAQMGIRATMKGKGSNGHAVENNLQFN